PAAETDDPRKAAVQAAIARAKAKKAAQAESAQPVTGADAQPAEETDDPRKAAVQAAIARAKAKKAAQAESAQPVTGAD
ncbi:hypothetical protein AB6V43_14845, partial [Stenotrophomonas maltophilia]